MKLVSAIKILFWIDFRNSLTVMIKYHGCKTGNIQHERLVLAFNKVMLNIGGQKSVNFYHFIFKTLLMNSVQNLCVVLCCF